MSEFKEPTPPDTPEGELADFFPESPARRQEFGSTQKNPRGLIRGSSSFTLDEIEEVDTHFQLKRCMSQAEYEIQKRGDVAQQFLEEIGLPDFDVEAYIPHVFKDAIFVGHLVTDMDSIAGSIGAADLYGGIAARASEVNSETQFCLQYWGMAQPQPIEDILELYPDAGVCLVDHQQMSQLNPAIDVDRIVGVIDHHALQNATIVTDRAIYMDIRPWGSMSTIIAHSFFMLKRIPRKCVAGMLLCAILSDTLNLKGPTTTDHDRAMATLLTKIAGVKDIQILAQQQFKAKSKELATLTADQLVNGDQKKFSFKTTKFSANIGFAVIETTDDAVIMAKKDELLVALVNDKVKKGLDYLYLAVVNIVDLGSNLICCSQEEKRLAVAAFFNDFGDCSGEITGANGKYIDPDNQDVHIVNLGEMVSRKKDFIPAITLAIKKGFANL